MTKTIFRVNRKSHFTSIPNDTHRDKSLSFKARGILGMLLSNTDDWVVHKSWIVEQGTEGREAVTSGLRELEKAGYATYEELREQGQFVGSRWTFHDTPVEEAKRTNYRGRYPGKKKRTRRYLTESPKDGFPSVGHPTDGRPNTKKTMGTEDHKKKEEEPENFSPSSLNFKKPLSSPNSRKPETPEQEKILAAWRDSYSMVHGRPYVGNRKDMEAITELITEWPDINKLENLIENAFWLIGHPKAWTCNNRMETIQAFTLNIDKISAEVSKYEPLPVVVDRAELHRRKKLWVNSHKMAVKFLDDKFGPVMSPAMLTFLRGSDDIGDVPAYFRCLISKEDSIVMQYHGAEAYDDLMDHDMPGFREFLRFKGWLMDREVTKATA